MCAREVRTEDLNSGKARAIDGCAGRRIITDLAVMDVTPQGLKVVEMAPGVTLETLQAKTGVKLH